MNSRILSATLVMAGSITLGACSGKAPTAPASTADCAAEVIPIPEGTVAAFADIMNSYDPDKLAAMLTDNARLLRPNAPAVEGKQAILDYYSGVVAAELNYDLKPTTAVMLGDVAVAEGTYRVVDTRTDTEVEVGKYMAVWVREDGIWKIAREMSNTDFQVARTSVTVGD